MSPKKEVPKYTILPVPIDRSQPGSWKAIKRIMYLSGKLSKDNFDALAFVEFMNFIESRCTVPDDAEYTLEDALDDAPFDDLMELVSVLTGEDTVGEANGDS